MTEQTTTTADPDLHTDPDAPVIETGKEGIREPTPYEKKLRTEAANRRREAEDLKKRLDTELPALTAKHEAEKAALQSEADQRVIRAELKALAAKEGMVDLDGLKLADLSKVKLTENGDVEGATELFAALKKDKPYLFGAAQGNSSTQAAPPPKSTEVFDARTARPEDVARRRQELTKGR
jgi:hypothetical protein